MIIIQDINIDIHALIQICTIVASKIKGTAREIYHIFPCYGDFPGGYTGKIPAIKATKSHMTRLHTVNSVDCRRNFGREWLALPEVERA